MPPILGYWAIRGLAQPIRLLLNYVGEEFEDVKYEQGDPPQYSREAWNSVKPTLGLPFPNLPYYIDGDMKITQSNAIMRYIGRKHNMLGSSEREKVRVDMMENQAMDFRNNVVRLCYNPEYEKLKVNYFKNLPLLLKQFEEFLGDDPWFGGKNITIVDFPMYELFDQHKLMESTSLDNFPKLCAFMKRFEELPNIKKYMSSDKFMSRPVNNKVAQFK